MNFDRFKKTFFPHLYFIQEGQEMEEERAESKMKAQMKKNKEKQPELILDRLTKLEKLLKIRFSN